MEQMNVFISWSGDFSKELAKTFSEWIPTVIQAVKTFYSPDDIHKGELWSEKITEELKSNYTGILCITKDNQEAPWNLFEAGALTNSIGKGKVFPLLFDMEISDLKGPITRFNATTFNKNSSCIKATECKSI